MIDYKKLLHAPESYWKQETTIKIRSKWKLKVIKYSLLGLDITEACNIHNYMYYVGETWSDKDYADEVFLHNLNKLIETVSFWYAWLNPLRKIMAKKYFHRVKTLGNQVFRMGEEGILSIKSLCI